MMTSPTPLTGPDYLIAAAQRFIDDRENGPFIWIEAFQNLLSELILEGEFERPIGSLPPHEQTATAVMYGGVQTVIASRDMENFYLYINSLSMLMIRFEEFLQLSRHKLFDDGEHGLDRMPWEQ